MFESCIPTEVFTNCLTYDKKLSRPISRFGRNINVSLDCGTSQTYNAVKGANAFNLVCDNLKKYHDDGVPIHLKYIFIEQNMGSDDITGFCEICTQVLPDKIILSTDAKYQYTGYLEGLEQSIGLMLDEMKKPV